MKLLLKIIFIFIAFFTISSCQKYEEDPNVAIKEIITAYNSGDYNTLWERTLQIDKDALTDDFENNKENYEFFNMMLYSLKLEDISAENITKPQYLYGLFKMVVGDEKMVFDRFEKNSSKILIAKIKLGNKEYNMPIVYDNKKWYMKVN